VVVQISDAQNGGIRRVPADGRDMIKRLAAIGSPAELFATQAIHNMQHKLAAITPRPFALRK